MVKVNLLECAAFWKSIDTDPDIASAYNALSDQRGLHVLIRPQFVEFLKEYYYIDVLPGAKLLEVLIPEKDFVWFSLKYDAKAKC